MSSLLQHLLDTFAGKMKAKLEYPRPWPSEIIHCDKKSNEMRMSVRPLGIKGAEHPAVRDIPIVSIVVPCLCYIPYEGS